jgi:hypothetical protein
MNNNRVHTLKPECSIPIANRGGVPHYPKSEGLQERLARCIEHELYYGGNHEAAAAAIIRDVNLGYIDQLTSSDNATPAVGEKAELVAWLRENANDERDIDNGGTIAAAIILDRIADILENINDYYFLPKPTDEELEDCAYIHGGGYFNCDCQEEADALTKKHVSFARAILARFCHFCIPSPISLKDRHPGPEDCSKQNKVWVYEGKYCPSYYTEPWKLTELPRKELGEDFSNAYFWRNVTHWLPYNAIPIPKTTDET